MIAGRVSAVESLNTALDGATLQPEDGSAVALARQYAALIDTDPEALVKVGPLLLAVLVELRLTPKARVAVRAPGGGAAGDSRSALDQLRARRDRRANGAATVDPASS